MIARAKKKRLVFSAQELSDLSIIIGCFETERRQDVRLLKRGKHSQWDNSVEKTIGWVRRAHNLHRRIANARFRDEGDGTT